MNWDLIFALFLGFFGMIGLYTTLRNLERWLLKKAESDRAFVLIFPKGDAGAADLEIRKILLSLEEHPIASGQKLLILQEEGKAHVSHSIGLFGEKTELVYVSPQEAVALLLAEGEKSSAF